MSTLLHYEESKSVNKFRILIFNSLDLLLHSINLYNFGHLTPLTSRKDR